MLRNGAAARSVPIAVFCLALVATRCAAADDAGRLAFTPVGDSRVAARKPAGPPASERPPRRAPPKAPPTSKTHVSSVWANEGGDKIAKEELRATKSPAAVLSSTWDGKAVRLFGARNEVLGFALILEAATGTARAVSVTMSSLVGPGNATLRSKSVTDDGVFDWVQRPVELFYVRYLAIRGLSKGMYDGYDERHVPKRLRRPFTGAGFAKGTWEARPDHDKRYPDILVPIEAVPSFDVPVGESQMVWVDVYLPKGTPAGEWRATLTVREGAELVREVPVRVDVRDFELPDTPSAQTMLYFSVENVNRRYLGKKELAPTSLEASMAKVIRDRHFQMAHRHRIALIDHGMSQVDMPAPEWWPRLDGTLFTAKNLYDGPGVGVGNGVYSIGTYGSWSWKNQGEAAMQAHAVAWETWFKQNSPQTERFLYLIDEADAYGQIQTWCQWIDAAPAPGNALKALATVPLPNAVAKSPALDIAAARVTVGVREVWQGAADAFQKTTGKRLFLYNGNRPATGTFATEDDGVALRVLAWTQWKKQIARWFFWEGTYYDNFQGGTGETDVFEQAQTFGGSSGKSDELGETGWNYSNGDGVLFYPGTDLVFPRNSYRLGGPLASLRLKLWRRGIQDADYLALASKKNAKATDAIVKQMIPKVLWEYSVDDKTDPTWVRTDISWSTKPDDWEAARKALANLIEGQAP